MNDKLICQLTLPAFLILYLAQDDDDKASKIIVNYITKHFASFCGDDLRMKKLANRISKTVKQINYYCANGELLSGKKMVLTAHFLTQLIFNEKDGVITDKYLDVAKKVSRIIRFATKLAEREVAPDDLEMLAKSSEKLARKVFEKFYKNI
jgi:hypothetical protein